MYCFLCVLSTLAMREGCSFSFRLMYVGQSGVFNWLQIKSIISLVFFVFLVLLTLNQNNLKPRPVDMFLDFVKIVSICSDVRHMPSHGTLDHVVASDIPGLKNPQTPFICQWIDNRVNGEGCVHSPEKLVFGSTKMLHKISSQWQYGRANNHHRYFCSALDEPII